MNQHHATNNGARFVIGTKASISEMANRGKILAFREITSDTVYGGMFSANIAQHPDALLRDQGLAVYDEMLNDEIINFAYEIWKLSILEDDIILEPSVDGGKLAQEQFEFARFMLGRLNLSVKEIVERMLTALIYGFALGEKVEETIVDGRWSLKRIIKQIHFKPPHFFKADVNDQRKLIGWRQTIPGGFGAGESQPLPLWKFLYYAYGAKFDSDYYGRSMLRPAYKYTWAKDMALRFWMIHLDRFSTPLVIGYMNDAASEADKQTLEKMLDNLSHGTSYRLPKDMVDVDVVKFDAATNYDTIINYCDKAIGKSMLILDLMGVTDTTRGAYNLGAHQFDLFYRMKFALQEQIINAINEQVIGYAINENYYTNHAPRLTWLYDTDASIDDFLKRYSTGVKVGALNPQDISDVNEARVKLGMDPISDQKFAAWLKTRGEIHIDRQAQSTALSKTKGKKLTDTEMLDTIRPLVEALLLEQGALKQGEKIEIVAPAEPSRVIVEAESPAPLPLIEAPQPAPAAQPAPPKTEAELAGKVFRNLDFDEFDHDEAEQRFEAELSKVIRESGIEKSIADAIAKAIDKRDAHELLTLASAEIKGKGEVEKVVRKFLFEIAEQGRLAAEDEMRFVRKAAEDNAK